MGLAVAPRLAAAPVHFPARKYAPTAAVAHRSVVSQLYLSRLLGYGATFSLCVQYFLFIYFYFAIAVLV